MFRLLWGHPLGPLAIALPLGISFFTFQQIAYLVDLDRGTARPHGLLRYALYVSFFPHLIAGPLLRHSEFFASLDEPTDRERASRLFGQGLVLVAIGLWKKVMIADSIGFAVDQLFTQAAAGPLGLGASWMAAVGFTLQIYFDFSGYSDIAIGLGFLFGIVIPFNFDAPYRAASIIDFWRRWHIDAVAAAARLRVLFLRREPLRIGAPALGADGDHADRRPLARGRLELRDLGRPARAGARREPPLAQDGTVPSPAARLARDLPLRGRHLRHLSRGERPGGLVHPHRPDRLERGIPWAVTLADQGWRPPLSRASRRRRSA